MPRLSNARENLIRSAVELFRVKGYHGVGLTELLTVSAAPKGSFYHHFPGGKEELGEATLLQAGKTIGTMIDASFAQSSTRTEAIDRLADAITGYFEKSGFKAGCPVASIAIDAVPHSARLTSAAQIVLEDWMERAAVHARRWGQSEEEAQSFGERLAIALEGAWIVARIQQTTRSFDLMRQMLRSE